MKASDGLRYADTGLRLTVMTLLLVGGGVWADKRWHTGPWLTLTGVILALGVIMRTVLSLGKKNDAS